MKTSEERIAVFFFLLIISIGGWIAWHINDVMAWLKGLMR